MNLTLSLTHDCNLACSYCYAGEKRKTTMPHEIAEKALDFAFYNRSKDEIQLGFFGGEPLLEWEMLCWATEQAEQRAAGAGIELKKTVTTNATLLTPDRVAWLKAHDFYPAVSIDGNRAMHELTRPQQGGTSSFDACMNGLDLIKEAFPYVEVVVVLDPDNIAHLSDSVPFLVEEKGVKRIALNPNFYREWPEEACTVWDAAYETIGDYLIERYRNLKPVAINYIDGKIITHLKRGYASCDRCGMGQNEIAVAPSGNIYPCERLIGADEGGAICIGNVTDGFHEKKRAAILRTKGNSDTPCKECGLAARCMNWCGCINYTTTGQIHTVAGIVCFHERLAIRVADRVGGILYEEANPAFLARFYDEDFSDLPAPEPC